MAQYVCSGGCTWCGNGTGAITDNWRTSLDYSCLTLRRQSYAGYLVNIERCQMKKAYEDAARFIRWAVIGVLVVIVAIPALTSVGSSI
jgi:hypothetical protein